MTPGQVQPILDALKTVAVTLKEESVPFALAGGYAVYADLADGSPDVVVALTHYAPVDDTLLGEPPEIWPFLGNYLLGQVVDEAGADLAVHGHAHAGVEKGTTDAGLRVRNVAHPVIRSPYAIYDLHPREDVHH